MKYAAEWHEVNVARFIVYAAGADVARFAVNRNAQPASSPGGRSAGQQQDGRSRCRQQERREHFPDTV